MSELREECESWKQVYRKYRLSTEIDSEYNDKKYGN